MSRFKPMSVDTILALHAEDRVDDIIAHVLALQRQARNDREALRKASDKVFALEGQVADGRLLARFVAERSEAGICMAYYKITGRTLQSDSFTQR